jgi:hypothetical protein
MLLFAPAFSFSQSGLTPWLPEKGEFGISPFYTFQTYDKYWKGRKRVDFPDTDQQTAGAAFEYGLFEDIALDATVSYVRSIGTRRRINPNTFADKDGIVDDGLNDATLGLRCRLLDEFHWDSPFVPSLAARLGGIIDGTYDANLPESPGDGAAGGEVSLLFGKFIGDTGFNLSGNVGFRKRGEDVPDDFFVSAGVAKEFFESLSFSFAYRREQGLSGPDIGDPGFTFPEVKEISDSLEYGVGYHDEKNRYLGLFVAHVIDGRNTAQKLIFGISIGIPFGGPAYSLSQLFGAGGKE